MKYCNNCGAKLVDGAKFCQKCGAAVSNYGEAGNSERQQEFVGKIYKCPNCGQVLHSFVRNCPSCGLELRGIKATSAVKEFASKLEKIESERESDRLRLPFSKKDDKEQISKTDEQKISLIQSFSIPNTKEDMLEFMILATSNVNMRPFNSWNTDISKSERAINDAWASKIEQVYEKAKGSYGDEAFIKQIQDLYDKYKTDVDKTKKKGILQWALLILFIGGWLPVFFLIVSVKDTITRPGDIRDENKRLEAIYQEAETSLENGEYKKALLNANDLEFSSRIHGKKADEMRRQWNIKRELLIDDIKKEAEKNGVYLEDSSSKNNRSNPADDYGSRIAAGIVRDGPQRFLERINKDLVIICPSLG